SEFLVSWLFLVVRCSRTVRAAWMYGGEGMQPAAVATAAVAAAPRAGPTCTGVPWQPSGNAAHGTTAFSAAARDGASHDAATALAARPATGWRSPASGHQWARRRTPRSAHQAKRLGATTGCDAVNNRAASWLSIPNNLQLASVPHRV